MVLAGNGAPVPFPDWCPGLSRDWPHRWALLLHPARDVSVGWVPVQRGWFCKVALGSMHCLSCSDGFCAKHPSSTLCHARDTGIPNAGQEFQSQPGHVHPQFGKNPAQRPVCTLHTFIALSEWP